MNSTQIAAFLRDGEKGKLYHYLVLDPEDGTLWLGDGCVVYRVQRDVTGVLYPPAVVRGKALIPLLRGYVGATLELPYTEVLGIVDEAHLKKLAAPKLRARLRYVWYGNTNAPLYVVQDGQCCAVLLAAGRRYVEHAALDLSPTEPLPPLELLRRERDVLGFSVTAHPLQLLPPDEQVTHYCAEVTEELVGKKPCLVGLVRSVATRLTRNGDRFAILALEDLSGETEVMVWPNVYRGTKHLLVEGAIIKVHATVSQREERLTCTAQSLVAIA